MSSRYDVAKRLYGAGSSSNAGGSSNRSSVASAGGVSGNGSPSLSMRYGTATADSADGWVTVRLDTSGIVTDADEVRCSCDSPISEGQRVKVLYSSTGSLVAIPIGDNIAQDALVSGTQQYAEGTDGTNAPTSGWSTSWPASADWVWARTMYTRRDGTVEYGSPWVVKSPPEGYEADSTVYATSSTASGTAAKVATVTDGDFELKSGAVVAVTFTNQNTASSPTLNVGSTGAKPVYTNGTRYAYWSAGATVLFLYDGASWQVCSTPVYASTATVGNPGSKNVYIDGTHVAIRNGTTEYATFDNQEVHVGLQTFTSGFFLANDLIKMQATEANEYYYFEVKPTVTDDSSNDVVDQLMVGIDDNKGYLVFTRSRNSDYPWSVTLFSAFDLVLRSGGRTLMNANHLDLSNCGSIVKPFLCCGASSSSTIKDLTSSNAIMTLNKTYDGRNNETSTSSSGVEIYRSGDYVYVTVPSASGVINGSTAYVEISASITIIGATNTNIGSGVKVSGYAGDYTTPSVTQIDAGLVSVPSSYGSQYATTVVVPTVVGLPRSIGRYARYRINLFARSSNATGSLIADKLTVKLI